jgi:hypothetical protein
VEIPLSLRADIEASSGYWAQESRMTDTSAGRKVPWLRAAVLLLAGADTVVFGIVGFAFLQQALSSNEQLGRSIGWTIAGAMAALIIVFALPALILGIRGRWLKLALILAIVGLALPLAMRFLT